MGRSSAGATALLAVLMLAGGWGPAIAAPASAAGAESAAVRVERTVMTSAGFVLPVPAPAAVLTRFRAPASRYGAGHRGVDLAAAVGSVVHSAGAGVVTHAGLVAGRGTVTVRHADGLRTTYEPVMATVRTGQAVAAGQPIGVLEPGHLACAPASCLHWGARLPDDSYLDPMGLIDGLQVRLLPWDQARG